MLKILNKDYLRWISRAWKYRLIVERQEILFMLEHLKPGQNAVDIGAHKGAYTYWMSKYAGANGNVFAFEPQSKLFNQLNKTLDDSKTNNVHVELLALSSNKGEKTLLIITLFCLLNKVILFSYFSLKLKRPIKDFVLLIVETLKLIFKPCLLFVNDFCKIIFL